MKHSHREQKFGSLTMVRLFTSKARDAFTNEDSAQSAVQFSSISMLNLFFVIVDERRLVSGR